MNYIQPEVGASRIGTPGSGPVDVDVLVVGGGAGLSAALMLNDLGVGFLPVERHPDSSRAPKPNIINPRTVEIFAQYDFADQVRATGSPPETFAKTRWYISFGEGTDCGSHSAAVAPSLTRGLDA
jgi:2,4-dichlorophenol 6-monooxygenase